MEKIHSLLALLDISLPARKVYLSLLSEGPAGAKVLAHRTGITRTSVYDQLRHLVEIGLVEEKDLSGSSQFAVSDLDKLKRLYDERQEKLLTGGEEIIPLLTQIQKHQKTTAPRIRFVEGKENIERLLYEMLFKKNRTIQTVWPYREMLELLGQDFIRKFNQERKRKQITLLALWPKKYKKDKTVFDAEDKSDITMQRRYVGKEFEPTMSYTICGSQVFCISSQLEMFGFVVDSTEFSDLMNQQFNLLWLSSSN